MVITRRHALTGIAGSALLALPACATTKDMVVYKTPTCGCCGVWADHVRAAGFSVEEIKQDDVSPIKIENQLPPELVSCHTALIDGYVIEGHVLIADIKRLLDERPAAIGLAVAGMPLGSPGMEQPDGFTEAYDVILFGKDGTSVFASYS